MVLIHMFKDQVEHHLTLQPLTMANIQQSEQRGTGTSLPTLTEGAKVLIHIFKDQVKHHLTLQPLTVADIEQPKQGDTGTSLQYTD
jgi:hypothetical protein